MKRSSKVPDAIVPPIRSIGHRRILNSHVELTTEFLVTLADGSTGAGASPAGETISIYEDRGPSPAADAIVRTMSDDGVPGRPLTQETFDAYLESRLDAFGRNHAYALSLAFFRASAAAYPAEPAETRQPTVPCLCLNMLNGGRHAYTNPVLSDFPEFLLVARSNDLYRTVQQHNALQRALKEALARLPKTVVCGNPVSRFRTADNRECFDFLLKIRDNVGLGSEFILMIDASAGDLWDGTCYRLAITDGSRYSAEGMCDYWLEAVRQYGIGFLEDPFSESDQESWRHLTCSQENCRIIGDNLYSSDAERIERGARERATHGVVIKPNQAGTVTGIERAVRVAQRCGQVTIASHRSISTEETFLCTLACRYGITYMKIGPLLTDYSSVLRFNELIRLTARASWALAATAR